MTSEHRKTIWRRIWPALAAVGVAGVLLVGSLYINNLRNDDRREIRDEQAAQFCEALPKAAAAGAQALIDIAVAQDIKEGASVDEIERTKKVGELYVARARELVLADLPSCPP